MRLAVNIDHFATLREARRANEPEPVLVALLAEQAGAHGIVCHIRGDRRHIKERDLRLLRDAVKTKLNVEMAATEEMKRLALEIKPDVVSLVPERPEELTTEGGLKVAANRKALGPHVKALGKAGIRTSIFIDTSLEEIKAAREIGVDLIEINTGTYADLGEGPAREKALEAVRKAAEFGHKIGLEVHGGHGLDYRNVGPIVAIPEIVELSIGFSIVARAAVVGIERAVLDMLALLLTGDTVIVSPIWGSLMNIRINLERLRGDLEELGRIGRDERGGISRPSFSPADFEARAWLQRKIEEAGLCYRQDGAGNQFGRLECAGKTVMAGSHIDTVPNGGMFDGAVGRPGGARSGPTPRRGKGPADQGRRGRVLHRRGGEPRRRFSGQPGLHGASRREGGPERPDVVRPAFSATS